MNITSNNYPATDENLRVVSVFYPELNKIEYAIQWRKLKRKHIFSSEYIPTEKWYAYYEIDADQESSWKVFFNFDTIEKAKEKVEQRKKQWDKYQYDNKKFEMIIKVVK